MLNVCRIQVKLGLKSVFSFEVGGTYNTAAKRESLPQGLSFKRFGRGRLITIPDSTCRNVSLSFHLKSPETATNSSFRRG